MALPVLRLVALIASLRCNPAAGKDTLGELHIVNQSHFPMAAAIDGSAPVYYVCGANSASASRKWVIYIDGGDFCGYGSTDKEQLEDCYQRSKTDLGSSSSYVKKLHFDFDQYSPLFDRSKKTNPLAYDWNWVLVPYLDGGYYAGTREDTPVVNGSKLHFRGAFNVEAIVASLAKMDNFRSATDFVLTGCSSGGVAVVANADHIHDLLHAAAPAARLSAFVDSGYYLNVNTKYWTEPPFTMQHIRRTLSAACLEARASSPWDCIVAEVAAPFVRRLPMFIAESRYDTNQLDCVNISSDDTAAVNAYGSRLLAAVKSWAGEHHAYESRRGAFVDGCSRHCSITPGIAMPGGLTAATAFSLFYHGSKTLNTSVLVQPGEYPCANCCNENFDLVV